MVRHYQRVRHISTGRFGLAILVQDAETGKLAVMKAMEVSSLKSAERLELLSELQCLAKLRHPHLCGLSECFLHQGKLCKVMDYLPGGNLATQVAAGRDLGDRILLWFTQALLAVDYLHRCNVLHRDLRLRRLLLTRQGLVVVTGVALSAVLKGMLSSERRDMEATRYLAPEILLQNEAHSSASDMWALGVILYELIALKPPWEHTDLAHLRDALRRPLRPLPARHAEVAPLCYSLLKRQPSQRWSAVQLLRHGATQSRLVELLKLEHEESESSWALPTSVHCWNSGAEKYPVARPLGGKVSTRLEAAKVQPSPRAMLPSRLGAQCDMYKTF